MTPKQYRQHQLSKLVPLPREPKEEYTLKIRGTNDSTHWLNISEEEFDKIMRVLLEEENAIR